MFTGIIEALGKIAALEPRDGDLRLRIESAELSMADVKLGDSIATNGVCLTVVELLANGYWADVSNETLAQSTFAAAKIGQPVNLEKAMLATSRFDGHIVSGHVDGMAEIISCSRDARSIRLQLQCEPKLARYIATKGSVCVDGVSLTVNRVENTIFDLNIVPHTAAQTIINDYHVGSRVNIEIDVVARYLERLLQSEQATANAGVSMATLAENGFLKAR